MSESQIIERSATGTIIRTGTNGQQLTIPSLLPILKPKTRNLKICTRLVWRA
jgi:hypothetical protein